MKILATILLLVCGFTFAQENTDLLLQSRLKAHIEFLAADELKGREAGKEGYDIAASYVASQFRQMGLIPAGSEESFFQQVPLRRAYLDQGSAVFTLNRDGEVRDFEFLKEFYRGANVAHTKSNFTAEMVFVGYGIDAPELDYTDFEGIDLKGKIAVTLAGQPKEFPSEEGAHFGSGREKARALISHGAVGWVMVFTPRTEKMFAWERLNNRVGSSSMDWLTAIDEPYSTSAQLLGGAGIHYAPAAELFDGADHSLENLLAMDDAGENPPVFPLKGKLTLKQSSQHEAIQSPNVAALLPGTDPVLSNEYVIYSAHLDHIGVLHGEGHEDAINNGAMDNAAGVSVMLETARMLAEAGDARRSIVFLAVTAEEKGLLGAEYFAQNPTVTDGSIVANINLDMPGLLKEFGDVIAFGADHSSLGGVVEQAAGESGIELTPDPRPELNVFVRSDHYRFVQKGIPSIYLVTGSKSLDGNEEEKTAADNFYQDHYHRVSDDLSLPFNYSAAARFTRINARIGEIIASQPERPSWNEGDFFGKTFSR